MATNDYNEQGERYLSHIPTYKRTFPPMYLDTIEDLAKGTIYDRKYQPNARDLGSVDYTRIGDCCLLIPPTAISIDDTSESKQFVAMRQKDSLKTKSGYKTTQISMPIVFNGLDQINGTAVSGPTGISYVDGLRPLIAQIKRSPFLPIQNYLLNSVNDIHSVVVSGLSIGTDPEFPDLLAGELTCFEFDAQPYITLPNRAFTDMIDWDLYRWYYNRAMDPNHKEGATYLAPIPKVDIDTFKFYIVDEKLLMGYDTIATKEDESMIVNKTMLEVEMPGEIDITSIRVGIGNIIKNIQLSDHAIPTTQYFGCTSTMIQVEFETMSEDVVQTFKQMTKTTERFAREYRNRTVQGYIRFEQSLVQLFGVDCVMIEAMKVDTVPEFPGTYTISMIMSSYDKNQSTAELNGKISPVLGVGTINDLLDYSPEAGDNWTKYRESYYDQVVEDMLNTLDLYPDLELPTWNEVNEAISKINSWRTNNGLSPLPYTKFDPPHGANSVKSRVDPDFYFCYPTLKQAGITEMIEDTFDIKQAGQKLGAIMNGTSNGWSVTRTSIYDYRPNSTSNITANNNSAVNNEYSTQPRGVNPSYAECVAYISQQATAVGLRSPMVALATAWRESDMCQFWETDGIKEDGQYHNAGDTVRSAYNAIGMMQVVPASWPDVNGVPVDWDAMRSDWRYNVQIGCKVLKWAQGLAIDYGFGDGSDKELAQATWCGYNAGIAYESVARWRDNPNADDRAFSEFYDNKPWEVSAARQSTSINTQDYTNQNNSVSLTSRDELISYAETFLGVPYVWGGVTPDGFDCSGFVQYVFAHFGYQLNRTSQEQYKQGSSISFSQAQPGDLLFFHTDNDRPQSEATHVGIYIGDNKMIHAPRTGDIIKISSTMDSYYTTRLLGARKFLDSTSNNGITATQLGSIHSNINQPAINYSAMGQVTKVPIGQPIENTKEGLFERMSYDMMTYNRRGTMCRAFPTYLMLFIDEGMWMNGRKLWSNYYSYHSIVDITVEKDRRKPADTAYIRLTNIYNTLGTNPKVNVGERNSWLKTWFESISWYSDDILNTMIGNKNALLNAFNVKSGARIHLRLGYGNHASLLHTTFSGTITEIDTQEIVNVVAQSDGLELTNGLVEIGNVTQTNTRFHLGSEPHHIIFRILSQRSNNLLYKISRGKWGESSAFGIEHFGNIFFNDMTTKMYEAIGKLWNEVDTQQKSVSDVLKIDKKDSMIVNTGSGTINLGTANTTQLGVTIAKTLGEFLPVMLRNTWETWMPREVTSELYYENYDLCKNIYIANIELAKTYGFKENQTEWWWKEEKIALYLYNRTPWDIFQIIARATPEFICFPHEHGFRSTLFFGIPHWMVRYKYEYVNENEIYEYAKPYQQIHLINSIYDIVNNSVKATPPDITNCVGTYGLGDNRSSADTVYADRDIKGEFQKTRIVDSTTAWRATDIGWLDRFLDWVQIDEALKLVGYNAAKDVARRVAISTVQDSFKDMYQGSLLILGDPAIKPYDLIYLSDNYTGMEGTAEVGRVIHHMGLETGFVTDIKPDLCVAQVEGDCTLAYVAKGLTAFGTAAGIYLKSASIANKIIQAAKVSMTGAKGVVNTVKGVKFVANALKSEGKVMTGIRNIMKLIKTGKTALGAAGLGTAPETLGAGLVITGVSLIILGLIDNMFNGILSYFRDKNVIKVYPLWWRDKPFVAGIAGHKDLIPGYRDEDIYLNYDQGTSEGKTDAEVVAEVNAGLTDSTKQEVDSQLFSRSQDLDWQRSQTLMQRLMEERSYKPFLMKKHLNTNTTTHVYNEYVRNNYDPNRLDYNNNGARILVPTRNFDDPHALWEPVNKTRTDGIYWNSRTVMTENDSTPAVVWEPQIVTGSGWYGPQPFAGAEETPVFAMADGEVIYAGIYNTANLSNTQMDALTATVRALQGGWEGFHDSATQIFTDTKQYNSCVMIKCVNIQVNNGQTVDTVSYVMSYYNMMTINVAKGDIIKGGDVIGTVGYSLEARAGLYNPFSDMGELLATGDSLLVYFTSLEGSNSTYYNPEKIMKIDWPYKPYNPTTAPTVVDGKKVVNGTGVTVDR